jgi:D-alanine transaminase
MIAYLNGEYLEKDKIRISPDDRGFLFADGLYEVVRFYNGKPFRAEEHQNRIENGAKTLGFYRTEFEEFSEVIETLQLKNNLENEESSIVYFQATRGSAPRSHSFPSRETPLTVYAFAREFKSTVDEQHKGAKAITVRDDRWANCDLKSIALLPNTLAHQKARDNNAIEAIFIRNNAVQEGTHSNVFIFVDKKVKTPPLNKYVLAGITRKAVLELCDTFSIPCSEESILKEDLYSAQEVFIVGTTVEITPIIQVDDNVIGDQNPGPVCKKLQDALWQLVHS